MYLRKGDGVPVNKTTKKSEIPKRVYQGKGKRLLGRMPIGKTGKGSTENRTEVARKKGITQDMTLLRGL